MNKEGLASRSSLLRAWIVAVAGLAVLALPLRAFAAGPNIILITLDTQRADRMGFLGSKRGLTPNLDALAQRSVVFTRAYSQAPLTTTSHATILTGTFPQFHGVNAFGKPLPAKIPYLPEILHEHGYRTAAFVGSIVLDPMSAMAPGFGRGFDTYDAGFRIPRPGEDRYQTVERRGGEVVSHALAWLGQNSAGPFFLWIHLYDAHDPYDPPAPYSTRFAATPYDGEIAYADSCVGVLLTALRTRNLYGNTAIAVMADHGESLGQHGEQTHGIFLYDETIHVPLLLKFPEDRFAGSRVESRVGLVDVAPTLLEIAGSPVPSSVQGESLIGAVKQASPHTRRGNAEALSPPGTRRPVYSETDYPHLAFGWSPLRSLRVGKDLYIEAPRRELYDDETDPGALHNLAASSPAISDTLDAELREFRRKSSGAPVDGTRAALNAQQAKQLGSLGYVAGGDDASTGAIEEGLADPKDMIQIANLMHDALLQLKSGGYPKAVPQLEHVLAEKPEMDKSGALHYELGLALVGAGNRQEAIPALEFAVAHAPNSVEAHDSLASLYAQLGRMPEALTELQTALNLTPDDYDANLLRGRILTLQDRLQEGLSYLEKAAGVEPSSVDAHLFMAEAYDRLHQPEKAKEQRVIADRLKVADPQADRGPQR